MSDSRTNNPFLATIIAFGATLLYATAGFSILHGCIGTPDAHERTIETWNRIAADGRITKEEALEFARVLGDEEHVNWPVTIGAVLASLVASLTGVGVVRRKLDLVGLQAQIGHARETAVTAKEAATQAHARLNVREQRHPIERS